MFSRLLLIDSPLHPFFSTIVHQERASNFAGCQTQCLSNPKSVGGTHPWSFLVLNYMLNNCALFLATVQINSLEIQQWETQGCKRNMLSVTIYLAKEYDCQVGASSAKTQSSSFSKAQCIRWDIISHHYHPFSMAPDWVCHRMNPFAPSVSQS